MDRFCTTLLEGGYDQTLAGLGKTPNLESVFDLFCVEFINFSHKGKVIPLRFSSVVLEHFTLFRQEL